MELKSYSRDSCVAVWSNSKAHGELLACASTHLSNSNLSNLEILAVDLTDPAKELHVEGKSLYNAAFRCLAWGTFGEKQGTLPYGLIFGGMTNGSFTLWNPADIVGKHEQIEEDYIDDQKSFIYAEQPDEDGYPIICAEWNPLKNNFLAYGSSSLFIIDVSKDLSAPEVFHPSSKNPHEGSYITSVTWNKEVPHVLASAGSDGLIALYDIKQSKSIFSFRDSSINNNQRQVEIAWSKHISTQIAVTLDDEKKNQLQIWDLRNHKGPIVVIDKGHSRGINSMDWSELDHDLILTAGRDQKIVCWNYKQDEEPLSTRQVTSEITKVAWSKALPSIYSVTTVEGVSICSLDDRNMHSYIPKWLKVPVSAQFNGNENIITYSDEKGSTMQQYTIKPQVPAELERELAILSNLVEKDNYDALRDTEGETGQFWRIISTKRQQEGDSDIYEFLGFAKEKIVKEVENYTGKKRDSVSKNNETSSRNKAKSKASKADYIPVSGSEAASFFGSLSTEPAENKPAKNEDENQSENIKYDMVPRNYNWDIGKEKLIKQNMLIGNYEGAIDAALKCGRTAQALIIAYSIDQTTFNSTLKTFFTETTDNFISGILKHIAFKDPEELVKKYDLAKWKQCVALIFSQTTQDKRKSLLNLLAQRIIEQQPESAQFLQAAIYCYILAEEFQLIVDLYLHQINSEKPNSKARKVKTVTLGTRLIAIHSCLTTNVKFSPTFERIIRQLGLICLEANKKQLSYNLFTGYIPQTSSKYIQYLTFNDEQLASQRTSNPVINLPVMAKKQEKVAKKVPKQPQYEQEPAQGRNVPGKPLKPVVSKSNPFNEPEPETRPQKYKGASNVPPPPPPQPVGRQSGQPSQVFHQQERTRNVPPPPIVTPSKKNQPFQDQDQEDEQPTPNRQIIPPPTRPTHTPPPPPPVFQKQNKPTSVEEAPDRPEKVERLPPPPPAKKVQPPPPPPSHDTHQVLKPTPQQAGKRAPPPPPPPKKQEYDEEEEEETPQPKKGSTLAPPPRPQQSTPQPAQQTPQNIPPRKNLPPPPPQKAPKYEQEQEEEDQQEAPQPPQRSVPVPPAKKNVPPPPPSKNSSRVELDQSYQKQEPEPQNESINQGRRMPPPPPSNRKVVPPPPPRR